MSEETGSETFEVEAPPIADPFEWFGLWFDEARATGMVDPNAMSVATVSPSGQPSVRLVLLKEWDEAGFVFYTNLTSRKAQDLLHHPQVGLNLFWRDMSRQIRVEGVVSLVDDARADAYFASRSRGRQLGAWASDQSAPLSSYAELEARVEQVTQRFEGVDVPRPPHWSGFCVTPLRMEFWQGNPHRLHDRWQFARDAEGAPWQASRVNP